MRKLLSGLISFLILTTPIALAQGGTCDVSAGDTSECLMETIDEMSSPILGAMISKIDDVFIRYIDWMGTHVWHYETHTEIQDYDLYALPTGQDIPTDWGLITDDGVFETSEAITLDDCVDCIFPTHSFSYDVTGAIQEETWGEGTDGIYSSGNEATCTDIQASVLRLGSSWTVDGYYWGFLKDNTHEIVCKFYDTSDNYYICGDWDKSGTISGSELECIDIDETVTTSNFGDIEFKTIYHDTSKDTFEYQGTLSYDMKGVTAQLGETLLITESGNFDIYGIV